MSDKFKVEIITPEKSILNSEANEVTIPSYEGQLGILKDHIPLITFLRPGIIVIRGFEEKKFYVEEGTVEFSNNNLLILSSTAMNLADLNSSLMEDLLSHAENEFKDNSSDKEKYLLSYKINTLREINQ